MKYTSGNNLNKKTKQFFWLELKISGQKSKNHLLQRKTTLIKELMSDGFKVSVLKIPCKYPINVINFLCWVFNLFGWFMIIKMKHLNHLTKKIEFSAFNFDRGFEHKKIVSKSHSIK